MLSKSLQNILLYQRYYILRQKIIQENIIQENIIHRTIFQQGKHMTYNQDPCKNVLS